MLPLVEGLAVQGPLSDLKVVELADMVSGPHAGKLLAAMGADTVKVERPGTGDPARHQPPFPGDVPDLEKSGLFLYHNMGKRSVTLDVETAAGVRLFRELVADADILLENHPPGWMAAHGLGYEELAELNPRLVFTSVTPFGQTGPYRDYLASDLVTFATSGVGFYTFNLSDDGEPPSHAPGRVAEVMAGQAAAEAALIAIFGRDVTGAGQWVDISGMETMANNLKLEAGPYVFTGKGPGRLLRDAAIAMQPEPAADAYVYVLVVADAHWAGVKVAMGNPEWAESPLFATAADRVANQDYMQVMLKEWYLQHPAEEVVELLQANGVTAGPVYDIPQAMSHETVRERNLFVEVDHPIAGPITFPGAPARMTGTPFRTARAPLLGEHTGQVLAGLGYSAADLVHLSAAGVI